jgi:hypothetical protein
VSGNGFKDIKKSLYIKFYSVLELMEALVQEQIVLKQLFCTRFANHRANVFCITEIE